jgi:hypothetical protein
MQYNIRKEVQTPIGMLHALMSLTITKNEISSDNKSDSYLRYAILYNGTISIANKVLATTFKVDLDFLKMILEQQVSIPHPFGKDKYTNDEIHKHTKENLEGRITIDSLIDLIVSGRPIAFRISKFKGVYRFNFKFIEFSNDKALRLNSRIEGYIKDSKFKNSPKSFIHARQYMAEDKNYFNNYVQTSVKMNYMIYKIYKAFKYYDIVNTYSRNLIYTYKYSEIEGNLFLFFLEYENLCSPIPVIGIGARGDDPEPLEIYETINGITKEVNHVE